MDVDLADELHLALWETPMPWLFEQMLELALKLLQPGSAEAKFSIELHQFEALTKDVVAMRRVRGHWCSDPELLSQENRFSCDDSIITQMGAASTIFTNLYKLSKPAQGALFLPDTP
jgi:hypothetical protein